MFMSRYERLMLVYSFALYSVVYESQGTVPVEYEEISDVVAGTGPDTNQNVTYGVTKKIPTSHNPAYDVVHK